MNLNELKVRLNQIAWDEQVNFEVSECFSEENDDEKAVEDQLRELGQQLTPSLLDALEQDYAYITWVLRLSPFVPNDEPKRRAKNLVNHQDSQVRYWAQNLLDA